MSTVLRKVIFQPGFNRNTTEYSAEDYYVEGDKVRFRNGKPEKIGGWAREVVSQTADPTNSLFTGTVRDIYDWTDLNFNKLFVVGSERKLEMFLGGQIYDVTPFREAGIAVTNAITTTSGESLIKITEVNHNLRVGDYIYVDSQQTVVDGITLAGEYTVVEVIDLDNFIIDSGTVATGSTTGGGGNLILNYLLEVGDKNNGDITGYGGGTWGTEGLNGGGYDMPRAGLGGAFLRQWSLDNWGEDGIACVREGKIYHWDATSGPSVRYQEISNAPTENNFVMVCQPYRHLISFGTQLAFGGVFDPLVIRWASQETLTEWNITPTNTAGEYRLPLGNYIVGAVQTRSEIIVFTDSTVYSMRYVGGSDIFQFNILTNNASAVSQHCGIDVNGIVYWMGTDGFYYYDGVVRRLSSSLDKYYFDQDGEGRITFEQKEKIFCASNKEFNEIIWLVPTAGNPEINRYIMFNYAEGTWYDGTIDRTVWMDQKIFSRPYAISEEGRLYIHEQGKDDDGNAMDAYIRSGYLDLQDGQDLLFVDRFIPDFKLIPNRNASLTLYFKQYPNSQALVKGPYQFNNNTTKINLRGRARQVSIEYRVNSIGSDFEVGAPRFGVQPDGER